VNAWIFWLIVHLTMPTFSAEQIVYGNAQDGTGYLLDANTGAVVDNIAFPFYPNSIYNTASPTVLASHHATAGTDPLGDGIVLLDYDMNVIANVQWGTFTTHSFPIDHDAAGNFYIANDRRVYSLDVMVRRYSAAGAQTGEWTLPYRTIAGMAVSRDGLTLYYAEDSDSVDGTYPDQSPLHRYDLDADAPLSDLIAGGGPSRWGNQAFMSDAGELFITRAPAHYPDAGFESWEVRRIDTTTGDVLSSYQAPNPPFDGFDVSIRPDLTDTTAFWMWTEHYGDSDVVTLTKVDIATGAVLRQFDLDNGTLHGGQTWWVQSTLDTPDEPPPLTEEIIGPLLVIHMRREVPSPQVPVVEVT